MYNEHTPTRYLAVTTVRLHIIFIVHCMHPNYQLHAIIIRPVSMQFRPTHNADRFQASAVPIRSAKHCVNLLNHINHL